MGKGVRSENGRGGIWSNATLPLNQGLDGKKEVQVVWGQWVKLDYRWDIRQYAYVGVKFLRYDHGMLWSVKCPDSEKT